MASLFFKEKRDLSVVGYVDANFFREKRDLSVVGYVDADYAEDLDDRRSTMGYVFTLAEEPICWRFMIQSTVAMSMN
jgi:hypothetical protein